MRKICIVTNEIFGPHKNGGIGTSQTFLAMLLANHSYSVDILYVGGIDHRDRLFWERWYSTYGITFVKFEASQRVILPRVLERSHEIYEFLKGRSYDTLIFQDWEGDGYASTCAKRVGELQDCTIVTWLHSPTLWLRFANQEPITTVDDLQRIEMERVAVEQSDYVISPSEYLLRWVNKNGWVLPEGARCMPLYIPNVFLDENSDGLTTPRLPGENGPPVPRRADHEGHLVFFGRLEFRKGIEEFAAAVRELATDGGIRRLTFIGKAASHNLEDVKRLIGSTEGITITHLSDLNTSDAIGWLVKEDPLIVVPSLVDNSPCVIYECLNNNLDFITTENGGMRELIHPEDWETHVCLPRGREIAKLIRAKIIDPKTRGTRPRPRSSVEENGKNLLQFFGITTAGHVQAPRLLLKDAREVTVVVIHFERPQMLDSALEALDNQTLKGFKVVLVDDHSVSEAARSKLTKIGETNYSFDLRIITTASNGYLGAARNVGIAAVDTKYVIFIDDDNLAMPNMVERFLSAINFSGADIVTSLMVGFEHVGNLRPSQIEKYTHWGFIPKSLAIAPVRNTFGDATSIYNCNAVRETGGYHEYYGVTHEDWELHLKAAIQGKRHEYVPSVTFWYRGSPDSMSRTTNQYMNGQRQIEAWSALLPGPAKTAAHFLVALEKRFEELQRENSTLKMQIQENNAAFEREELSARMHLKRISQVLHQNWILQKLPASLGRIIRSADH